MSWESGDREIGRKTKKATDNVIACGLFKVDVALSK